jgi:hypothetical protein
MIPHRKEATKKPLKSVTFMQANGHESLINNEEHAKGIEVVRQTDINEDTE